MERHPLRGGALYVVGMRILILALGSVALSTVALAVLPALGAPEAARPKRGNADLKTYCSGDALTYCGDIDPDSREMEACFKTHRAELSENCRRAVTAYEAQGRK